MVEKRLLLPDGFRTISPFGLNSIGASTGTLGTPASAVWPLSNLAIFVPFRVSREIVATKMFTFNGAAVSGNNDIGIYSSDGTRLVSMGSTAQSGTTTIQTYDITDTGFGPGLYYLALSHSEATTGTFYRSSSITAALGHVVGMAQVALGSVTLTATVTLATTAYAYVPVFGLIVRSFV